MLKIDHLEADELRHLLRRARLDSAQAYHVENCASCRSRLGKVLLNSGLFKSADPSEQPDDRSSVHLTGPQLNDLHAQTFEREVLGRGGMTHFIATLRHVAECDDCFTRFLELHEALSPSEAMVEGALSSFRAGRTFRRAGVMSIVRTLAGLDVQFAASSEDVSGDAERLERPSVWINARSMPAQSMSRSVAPPEPGLDAQLSMRKDSVPYPMNSDGLGAALSGLQFALKTQLELTESLRTELTRRRSDPSTASRRRDFGKLVERLSESAALHREHLDQVLQLATDELLRRERLQQLEHEFRTREDQSPSSAFEFDGIALEVMGQWRAGQCLLMFTARDPSTQSPISSVHISVVEAAAESEVTQRVTSDEAGRAELIVSRSTAALEIEAPSSRKPWRLQLNLVERPPTLADVDG